MLVRLVRRRIQLHQILGRALEPAHRRTGLRRQDPVPGEQLFLRFALKVEKPIFPQWKSYDVLLACLNHKPEPEIRRLAAAVPIDTDPEVNYYAAAHLSYCGDTEAALRLLKTAIHGGYCSYPAIETDPFCTRIRGTPEYDAVRSAGMACQNAFLEQRGRL